MRTVQNPSPQNSENSTLTPRKEAFVLNEQMKNATNVTMRKYQQHNQIKRSEYNLRASQLKQDLHVRQHAMDKPRIAWNHHLILLVCQNECT